jgi:hypothetical protein
MHCHSNTLGWSSVRACKKPRPGVWGRGFGGQGIRAGYQVPSRFVIIFLCTSKTSLKDA